MSTSSADSTSKMDLLNKVAHLQAALAEVRAELEGQTAKAAEAAEEEDLEAELAELEAELAETDVAEAAASKPAESEPANTNSAAADGGPAPASPDVKKSSSRQTSPESRAPRKSRRSGRAATGAKASSPQSKAAASRRSKKTAEPQEPPQVQNTVRTRNPAVAAVPILNDEEEGRTRWESLRVWLKTAPSWLVSLMVHVVLIVVLAIMSIAQLPEEDTPDIVGTSTEEVAVVEEIQEVEIDVEELDEATPLMSEAVSVPNLAEALGEVGTEGVGELAEVGAQSIGLAELGDGIFSPVGDGELGKATFFGIESSGNRFVYLVDNSKSMKGGLFEKANLELMRSISQFTKQQQFYVIYFSDTAHPMFEIFVKGKALPGPAGMREVPKDLVPGTSLNKQKLAYWIPTVPLILRTDCELACQMAFKLRPDAIYILTDGGFTDNTEKMLHANPDKSTPIHTIAFTSKNAEKCLKGIAEAYNGTYRYVP